MSPVNDSRRTGDELLRVSDLQWAGFKDFASPNPTIFIHGFTADGSYLTTLGRYFQRDDFTSFIYNYDSYLGIDDAAANLASLLSNLNDASGGSIQERGLFIVAHSMGGLVTRAFSLSTFGLKAVRGIALLGTPNDGALQDQKLLSHLIEYGESISEVMPFARNPLCRSALQLMKGDGRERPTGTPLIDDLNTRWKANGHLIPVLTVSGGKRHIELGDAPEKNWLANMYIQKAYAGQSNDGLVTEKSVELASVGIAPRGESKHLNTYPAFPKLNHTNLIQNQDLALRIISWFRSLNQKNTI